MSSQSSPITDTSPLRFNHAFTPDELAELNVALSNALQNTDIDDQSIEKIISERANLVDSLLNNLDEQQKRCFAAYEIKTNDAILLAVSDKRSQVKTELGKVSKASKGIKKYHQV
jgi:archaellum component FlaC